MKILPVLLLAVSLLAVSLVACHQPTGCAVPSTKSVDSAAAAAPDTIKPLLPDSVPRGDSAR